MSRIPFLGSLLCALALNAAPVAAQSAESEILIATFEQMGCVVTRDNQVAFLAATGLGTATLEAASAELFDAGILQVRDDGLVFTGGTCAANAEATPEAPETLVATMVALRDNGCAVSEGAFDTLFGPLGPRDVIMGHLRDLDATTLIHISSAYSGAVASGRVCEATDAVIATFAAQVAELLALDELNPPAFVASRPGARLLFVEWLVAQGCQIPSETILEGSNGFGFDNTLAALTVPLLSRGLVEVSDGVAHLNADLCAGTPEDRRAAVFALGTADAPLD